MTTQQVIYWITNISKISSNYLIAIDLSKQTELENTDLKQQINFVGRLEKNNATMFFVIEKKEETTFDFSQNSVVLV